MRRARKIDRIPVKHFAPAVLTQGSKRCRAILIDFSPGNCALRVNDPAFDAWTIENLSALLTITLHGESRTAQATRLQRVQSSISKAWVLGLVLR